MPAWADRPTGRTSPPAGSVQLFRLGLFQDLWKVLVLPGSNRFGRRGGRPSSSTAAAHAAPSTVVVLDGLGLVGVVGAFVTVVVQVHQEQDGRQQQQQENNHYGERDSPSGRRAGRQQEPPSELLKPPGRATQETLTAISSQGRSHPARLKERSSVFSALTSNDNCHPAIVVDVQEVH